MQTFQNRFQKASETASLEGRQKGTERNAMEV